MSPKRNQDNTETNEKDGKDDDNESTDDEASQERRAWIALIPFAAIALIGIIFYAVLLFVWTKE